MVKNKANGNTGKKKKAKSSPRKRKQYKSKNLQLALEAINKGMSKKLAAKTYGVPRTTLIFQIQHPNRQAKPGPSTVLTAAEEDELIQWIILNSRKGFPRRKEDLITSVAEFLKKVDRPNPFKDGVPGEKWYKLFLKRHPELALRTSESVTTASSCVSEADIRHWFCEIEDYLKTHGYADILKDPARLLNGDETNFQLCPKSGRVLSLKGEKNVYEVDQGQAKSSLTVLFTFKADGEQTPPLVIYPYKRIPKDVVAQVPREWGIGLSDNGWMKTEIFIDYLKNVLHPHLIKTKTKLPVILFVDGHKTHVTLSVSELCSELDIILIALYPNATRILQPADVSAFKPLKNGWKKSVLEWRRNNPSQALTKIEFSPILKKALENSIRPDILQKGFRATGLYPWDPNNINFDKCLGKSTSSGSNDSTTSHNNILLTQEQFLDFISRSEDQNEILSKVYCHFRVPYPPIRLNTATSPSMLTTLNKNILVDIAPENIDSLCSLTASKHTTEGQMLTPIDQNYYDLTNLDYDISSLPVVIEDDVELWGESQDNTRYEIIHEVQVHNLESFESKKQHKDTFHAQSQINPGFHDNNSLEIVRIMSDTMPIKCDSINKQNAIEISNCKNEIKTHEKKVNLKDCLVVAKTPARKGVKNTAKTSFVLTSAEFQNIEQAKLKEKQKKIEDIQRRKEDRILKREQQKQQPKKIIKQKISPSKKIKVISDIHINPQLLSEFGNENIKTSKQSYETIVSEKIEKIKMKLNFDTKKNRIKKDAELKEKANEKVTITKAGPKTLMKTTHANVIDKVLCETEIERVLKENNF